MLGSTHPAGRQRAGQTFPHASLEDSFQSFLSALGGKAREHLLLGGEPSPGDRFGIELRVQDRPEFTQYALCRRGLVAVVESDRASSTVQSRSSYHLKRSSGWLKDSPRANLQRNSVRLSCSSTSRDRVPSASTGAPERVARDARNTGGGLSISSEYSRCSQSATQNRVHDS